MLWLGADVVLVVNADLDSVCLGACVDGLAVDGAAVVDGFCSSDFWVGFAVDCSLFGVVAEVGLAVVEGALVVLGFDVLLDILAALASRLTPSLLPPPPPNPLLSFLSPDIAKALPLPEVEV